jgi:alanine dehydrogenase
MSICETLFLGRADVQKLLSMEKVLEVVEAVLAAHGRQETRMPAKIYLDLPEYHGDFRAMPAYIPSFKVAGVKWVSSYTDNPKRGLPAVIATLILSDPVTAQPLAVMDATYITLMRTGAASGVATKYLARKNAHILALIGVGVQSHAQLEAIRLVRPVDEVRLYDPSQASLQAFHRHFDPAGLKLVNCESAQKAVEGADVVVTATPSRQPIVWRGWVTGGTHFNAIGADAPGKQELDGRILKDALVFVDDEHQAFHSGEVNVPLATGELHPEEVHGTLGQVVAGLIGGRTDDGAITVFDSTGLAVQDLAVAKALYDHALKDGAGHRLPLVCQFPEDLRVERPHPPLPSRRPPHEAPAAAAKAGSAARKPAAKAAARKR